MQSIIKVLILTVILFLPMSAKSEGFSLYAKAGYFDLNEKVNGKQYVGEQGAVSEIGVAYKNSIAGIDVTPSLGVWGGVLDYEGSDLDLYTPARLESTTGVYGVKAGIPVSKLFVLSSNVSIGPIISVDVNFFVRTVGERWLVLSTKGGLKAQVYKFELTAGLLYPFYTSDTIYGWPTDDFTVHPKGMITAFADLKYKINKRWDLGAYYEMWRWSASGNVKYNYTGSNTSSVIANGSSAYQPDTRVLNAGISIVYNFGF